MKVSEQRLGFIGFGHMAQVICKAIDSSKQIPRSQMLFVQRDTQKMKRNEQQYHITATSLENLIEKSDIIVLAVRPNQADVLMKELVDLPLDSSKLVVSLLAGVKLSYFERHLGSNAAFMRLMPNVASELAEGMTIFSYGSKVSEEFRSMAYLLFSCLGSVAEVPEKLMDVASSIAGCGPAFVLKLIDAFARFGEKEGIPYESALAITAQTFLGAVKMVQKGGVPETLIDKIAVPQGMTEAGLKIMSDRQIVQSLHAVIAAAQMKSKQFSEEFS